MDSWFRPVFARRQTPTQPADATGFSAIDSYGREETTSKHKATSRRVMRRGFWLGSPSVQAPATFPNTPATLVIQTPDRLYHKPSTDQIVETLKVVMMNQSSLDQVPVQYNSCILHVLEAYYDLQIQLQQKTKELESIKKSHTRDIDDFDEMTKGWCMKENDYQKEVKRLEVLLSNTEGGMEAVAMARSRSLVHGSTKASESIGRGIGTIRERNYQGNQRDTTAARTSATARSQISDSVQFHPSTPRRVPGTAASLQTSVTISNKASFMTSSSSSSSTNTQSSEGLLKVHTSENWSLVPAWARATLGNRNPEQRRRGRQETCSSRGSSAASGAIQSHISMTEDLAPRTTLQGLQMHLHDKPLPDIPVRASERQTRVTRKGRSFPQNDTYSSNSLPYIPVPPEMGFSFRPGDDASILSPKLVEDEFESHMYHKDLVQQGPQSTQLGLKRVAFESESIAKRQPDTRIKSSTVSKLPHIPREFRGSYDSLSRDSSTSSVVTAVRDNSGRSSMNSTQHNKQTGKPKLDRGIGNAFGDAVAAAAKALAKGEKNQPGESTATSSGSGEGSDIETATQSIREKATSGTSNILKKFASHQELRGKGP